MKPTFNYDDIFPDRWLHAEDLQGKAVTLTITAAYQEDLRLPGGTVETCGILSFAKTKKEYVLNKSNAMVLRDLWGDQSGEWAGHRIVLEAVPDTSGKSSSGYRILFTGSPDLPGPVTVKQPQNKTRVIRATGAKQAPAPGLDEGTGEVLTDVPTQTPTGGPETGQNGAPGVDAAPDTPAGVSDAETADSYWPTDDAGPTPEEFGMDAEQMRAANAAKTAAGPKANALLVGKLKVAGERAGKYEFDLCAMADAAYGVSDLSQLSKRQAEAMIAELDGKPGSLVGGEVAS